MTEADELTEMQRQYRYATPVSHILVEGALYLRCQKCRVRPVPYGAFITLCDPCLADATRAAAESAAAVVPSRLEMAEMSTQRLSLPNP